VVIYFSLRCSSLNRFFSPVYSHQNPIHFNFKRGRLIFFCLCTIYKTLQNLLPNPVPVLVNYQEKSTFVVVTCCCKPEGISHAGLTLIHLGICVQSVARRSTVWYSREARPPSTVIEFDHRATYTVHTRASRYFLNF
jgi:hypothetical protein